MKRVAFVLLAGLALLSCRKDAPSVAVVPPWEWVVTGMKPGSVAAEPALLLCEANGSGCAPVKAGVKVTGNKLLRLERGVSEFQLDAATRVEVAEGSEISLQDSGGRTLELRAGGVALSRAEAVPSAGPLRLKLVDQTLELLGRTTLVAHMDHLNRGQVFVTRGVLKTQPAGREFHAGEGAVFERAAPPDMQAVFSGQVSKFRQAVLAIAHTPPPPSEAVLVTAPRGLGTMTARVPGTTAVVGGVRLAQHRVKAVVRDGVAQTEVEEVFQNDSERVLEGRYVFPLPADATITGLTLYVNDKPVEGELVEKKRAAAIFKSIVEDTVRPRDPALLEWVRGSEFSLKVFPIPAKGSRKVVLRYQQALTADGPSQAYVYPLSLGAERGTPIDELSIDVELSDGGRSVRDVVPNGYAATVSSLPQATHVALRVSKSTPDHDFTVSYRRPTQSTLGAAEPGFVAMRLRAELPPGAALPAFQRRDRVLVVDASHSQSKESFAAVQQLALTALRSLEPDERFAVLLCDSACEAQPKSGLATAAGQALADAEASILGRKPAGASDLAGALKAAVERVPAGAAVQLVYVGDGAASAGELSVPRIANRVRPSFEQRQVDLRLFGAGTSVDEVALAGLARELGGAYDNVQSAGSLADASEVLVNGLRAPLLVAPTLEVPGAVSELEPRVLPSLRLGEEFVVVGRYDGRVPFNVTLRGRLGADAYSLVRAVGLSPTGNVPPFAARLWAEARIRELQTSADAAARSQVIELSKRFRVMSRETSWLVLENEQMFADFGIPRRKPTPELQAGGPSQLERSALASELDAVDLGALAAASSGSVATGPAPSRAADSAAEAEAPKKSSPAPASAPPSPAPGGLSGNGASASSGGLGSGTGTGTGSGSDVKVAGPRGDVSVGAVAASGGSVGNAARVVAGMRAGFRSCYQRGLGAQPDAAGSLRLSIGVGPGGEVTNVTSQPTGTLPASVVSCVLARARASRFDAPDGGRATLVVPVTFVVTDGGSSLPQPLPRPPGAIAPRPTIPLPADVAVSRPGDELWQTQGQAALDKLTADLAASPSSRQKHEALVRGLLVRGRFVPALRAAERFVELDPDLALARELLAYAAVATGDRARGAAAVDALTENAPTELKAQARAARAFEALGDEARACAHWRSVFELAPTSDSALFEALRCRARVLGDREAALRDAQAVARPGPLLQRLLPQLLSGQAPAFERSSGSAGQFEATLTCEPAADCPYVIVITPTGTVFSPWTPALGRSGPSSFAFSGLLNGVYRVLLVGGAVTATGRVEVRALNARNSFNFTNSRPSTLASTTVTLAPTGGGPSIGLSRF